MSTKSGPSIKLRRNSRVSGKVSAVDCLDQLLRHFDNLLSSQSDAVVLDDLDVVVTRVVRFLDFFVRGLLRLCYDAFTCPKCLFDNKSIVKTGLGARAGM